MSKIIAKYPSNIALVKYWGKYGYQLPCNPSISLTLKNASTTVELEKKAKTKEGIELDYFFEGIANESFKNRMVDYIGKQPEFEQLFKEFAILINSENTFPHSAGIASSASAFAAISGALLKASGYNQPDFNEVASNLARKGSGSACRSYFGPYALWGELDGVARSNNEYAVPLEDIHTNFQSMCDTILIVEDQPKKVSSSVGHGLMKDHPYAAARFVDAKKHCNEMLSTLKSGDFNQFISITEREALSLHAMMMTSGDYYLLMKSGTIQIIEQLIEYRKETDLPICFTLDAGPNVHLLYPKSIEEKANEFIKAIQDQTKSILYDEAGFGGEIRSECNK
ncbi:MAG: diphosphomevalonate decarboxylase [Crocinitomicaceae bacterium]|nr:diphosphomevalonate decarboxylase [Crocinitomicaceae bacterium]